MRKIYIDLTEEQYQHIRSKAGVSHIPIFIVNRLFERNKKEGKNITLSDKKMRVVRCEKR